MLRGYLTVKIVNTFFFLWYTAANVFIFSLALNVSAANPQKYGYGLGKETLLTPSPFIYTALFVIHLLFAGMILYVQWTEKGRELVLDQFGLGFSLLMALGALWAGAWVRRLYILAFVFASSVFLVSTWIYIKLKKNNRFTTDSDILEYVFVHLPFSLYHGWSTVILAITAFAALAPLPPFSGTWTIIFAVWLLALLAGISVGYTISVPEGDIASSATITFGLLALFVHRMRYESSHGNNQPIVMWVSLAATLVSAAATIQSGMAMWKVRRSGLIRLDEVGGVRGVTPNSHGDSSRPGGI